MGYLKEKLYFYTLGDYILKCITGQEVYIHPTNAAATGLYDLRKGIFNKKITAFVSDDLLCFPNVVNNVRRTVS